ncbi:MAG: FeoB-associated Cys-rich membrane protein [Pirellulales bacterium]
MNLDWQTAAVLVLIAAACAYLARAAWRTAWRRKAGACGGCGTCPSNPAQDERDVVSVGELARTAQQASPEAANRNGARRG